MEKWFKRRKKGIIEYNNGDIYDGNWLNDKIEGEGKIEYNNGDIYIGNFKNYLKEGKGILITSEGKFECIGKKWNKWIWKSML